MADVFISYKREDGEKARKVAELIIVRGYSVWWDASLLPSEVFANEINEQLDKAKIAITLWSEAAFESQWVLAESQRALESGKYLGVLIGSQLKLPVPYNSVQSLELTDPDNDLGQSTALLNAIELKIGPPKSPSNLKVSKASLRSSEAEAAFFLHIGRGEDIDALRLYLKHYGDDGQYAIDAKQRIAELENWWTRTRRFCSSGLGLLALVAGIIVATTQSYEGWLKIKSSHSQQISHAALSSNLNAEKKRVLNYKSKIDDLEKNTTSVNAELRIKILELSRVNSILKKSEELAKYSENEISKNEYDR